MPWPNDDHLRVVFRRVCMGCKIAKRCHATACAWSERHNRDHVWWWEYRVRWNGVVVSHRPGFATFERSYRSMVKTVTRLDAAGVVSVRERP